jgi:uncharacterized protein (TIGR02453 family)
MDFKKLLHFLSELDQNNHTAWMDAHRDRYKELKEEFIEWLDQLDHSLAAIDKNYFLTPGKKGINRINNNLMFHPHKPVYKDHFGAGLDKAPNTGDFYIEIGIRGSLCAGGLWRPGTTVLRSVRDAIDYDGDSLVKIIRKPSFRHTFGGLYTDEKLKSNPKGYPRDHPHIELLRHKTFAVEHRFTENEVTHPRFMDTVQEVYMEMLPFRRWLNKAISV